MTIRCWKLVLLNLGTIPKKLATPNLFVKSMFLKITSLNNVPFLTVLALCCLSTLAVAQTNQRQIQIKETIWAFNGKIQPGQFNPVSILIDNGRGEALDGQFILQRSNNLISTTGAAYQQSAFIVSTARQWVHFYPYVPDNFQSKWQLRLLDNETGKTISLGQIQQPNATQQVLNRNTKASGLLQAIVLLPQDSAAKVPTNLKRYPEEIFPPYVTATTPLHTVFLDHSPDWEEPRQKAFMDWLSLGGNVHILKSRSGQYPKFTGLLTSLDQPLTKFNVGQGQVQRRNIRLKDFSEEAAEVAIRSGISFDRRLQTTLNGEELEELEDEQAQIDASPSSLDMQMFQQMQERTLPEHNWLLIFFLAIVYILLIFPGCYLLSKNRQLHFLTTYAAVAGLSLLFSVVFLLIGQRGYGESTWLQTLAVAKVADSGDLAVQQWNTLFVTGGDQYQLTAPDSQALLTAGVTGDNTRASIIVGKEANISVRIPPYSAQSLNSTRYLTGNAWNLRIVEQQSQGSQLIQLKIQTDDSFLPVNNKNRFYAIAGEHIYSLKYDSNKKQLNLFGSRQTVSNFCRVTDEFRFMRFGMQSQRTASSQDPDEIYLDEIIPRLVHRSFLTDHISAPGYLSIPPDRIRLLALTTLPKELDLQISSEARRTGWILYTRDLIVSQ